MGGGRALKTAAKFAGIKGVPPGLKRVIDEIFLSSNSLECEGSQVSVQQFPSKSCVIEPISNPSVPNYHALQAFQLLSASPEAQTVVDSIVCDANIWNAILQNPALQDFFQSQQLTVAAGSEVELGDLEKVGEFIADFDDSGKGYVDLWSVLHNVKLSVGEMVSSTVSNCLQKYIFGFSSDNQKWSAAGTADATGNYTTALMDHIVVGGTFLGLAVLVVTVAVLKRA